MIAIRASRPLIFTSLLLAACGGAPQGGPGGPGGEMPPSPVEMVTLAKKPVEESTEFVGLLKSRRSTAIQPQVEGFITKILVRPGERVGAGAVLFEVDSTPQQAAVASQQSVRTARAAEVEFARKQAARARKLFEAGAASQRDAEEAETAFRSAEAQLKAADEQVRQQGAQLAYYKVTSSGAGVVGDIPVRLGDRVTNSTLLTTIDGAGGLEINVSVPVSQAKDLKPGLEARVIEDGAVSARARIAFVSPNVDDSTQTILVKAPLPAGGGFRADQSVRVRIVWRATPGLTVPVVAVNRVNGQYFAFTAEKGDKGLVAKQRAVTLGEIIGSDYVVKEGLKEGEQLIVGGLQKIGDGAPVMPAPAMAPPAGAGPAAASEAKGK